MRRFSTHLFRASLSVVFLGSLAFGVEQALATPAIRAADDECWTYSDPNGRCKRLCQQGGSSGGVCDFVGESGFCICFP
jgi:hypothetical protein